MFVLRQSTAVDVLIGPFVDRTDGFTAETGESPSVSLSKNGQTLAAKNDATTPTHDANGYYNCELDATDTNTVGTMVLIVPASANALPIRHEFQIIEENVYDAIYDSGATLGTDITGIDTKVTDIQGAGFSTGTDSLEAIRDRGDAAWTGGQTLMDSGTAQAGSSTTITLEAGFNSNDDIHNGQLITITSGTGLGQSRAISDYNGTTGVATIIGTWAINPDATSVYEITPADIDEITNPPSVADIADGVWDEPTVGHTTAGSFGEQVKIDIDAILVDTNVIGTPNGVSVAADIASIQTDTTAIVADTNELQGDWTDGGRLDLILDDIVADTADMQPKLGSPAVSISADIATIDGNVDAILLDTAEIGAAGAGLTDIGGFSAAALTEINTEVLDVIDVDTRAEPGQGSPGATITLAAKIDYLYKWTRNRKTVTATEIDYYNAGATIVDQTRTHSDDTTTYDEGTISTGP